MNSTKIPSSPHDRLERLLGGAELAPLRLRMRRYFERVDNGAVVGILRVTQLSAIEHEILSQLTGSPPSLALSAQIDIRHLDAALREAGIASSLRNALELIDGPIVDRAAHRKIIQAQWDSVTSCAHWHAALMDWLQTSTAVRLLKRLTRQDTVLAQQLLARADIVLRRLPADGVPLSQLAAETLGDVHALDRGEPTATIILTVWRCQEGRLTSEVNPRDVDDEQNEVQLPDERVRDIWARAGVLINELARPVLFLNLPVASHDTTMRTPGDPGYLSLRGLLRTPPDWAVNGVAVFVCENPI